VSVDPPKDSIAFAGRRQETLATQPGVARPAISSAVLAGAAHFAVHRVRIIAVTVKGRAAHSFSSIGAEDGEIAGSRRHNAGAYMPDCW
jgi:hypothetical protein